jgi:hypothetical protein
MQVIFAFHGGPVEYVRDGEHRKVARPDDCPICGKFGVLRAHGYYSRSVSAPGRIRLLLILIRRFLCCACRLTTSMLPDFAQPYRLVATDTVDEYFSDARDGNEVNVWLEHLARYQKRLDERIPETRAALETAYDMEDLPLEATDLWLVICRNFDGARRFTARFASEVGMTVFGIYGCHRPAGKFQNHTGIKLARGREPPSWAPGHENAPATRTRLI